jgi:hypothetical protein
MQLHVGREEPVLHGLAAKQVSAQVLLVVICEHGNYNRFATALVQNLERTQEVRSGGYANRNA